MFFKGNRAIEDLINIERADVSHLHIETLITTIKQSNYTSLVNKMCVRCSTVHETSSDNFHTIFLGWKVIYYLYKQCPL